MSTLPENKDLLNDSEKNATNSPKSEETRDAHVSEEVKPARKTGRRKSQLDKNEIRQLKEAFAYFDSNHTGEISTQEIGKVMKTVGFEVNEEELGDVMHDIDANGDGHMDFDEFVVMMDRRMSIGSQVDEMKATFTFFDKNGDGKIDFDELKEVLFKLGEEVTDKDVRDMIQDADINGDGCIDFQEFVRMMLASEDEQTKMSLLLKA